MTFFTSHHTIPAITSASTTARLGSNAHDTPAMIEFIAGVRASMKSDHTAVSTGRGPRKNPPKTATATTMTAPAMTEGDKKRRAIIRKSLP